MAVGYGYGPWFGRFNDVCRMSSTGIFGGTFDPIHYGHLRTAFELLQALGLDEVRFMPCGDPPHRNKPRASAIERLAMVQLATRGQAGFVVDDREQHRAGPSYSVDTLRELRQEHPDDCLCLVVGMDAFLGLPGWHEQQDILKLAHIIVAHRPGWKAPTEGSLGELLAGHRNANMQALRESNCGLIYIHEVTQLEISSTNIRELVAAGRDPRFLMPDSVRDFINKSGCYRVSD